MATYGSFDLATKKSARTWGGCGDFSDGDVRALAHVLVAQFIDNMEDHMDEWVEHIIGRQLTDDEDDNLRSALFEIGEQMADQGVRPAGIE